jgi:hypothetical protein
VSGLDNLRALAQGRRPPGDGLLGNARCAWGRDELLSEEAILAAFAALPFDLEEELLSVETAQGAALIGEKRALVADLYGGRIGRLWRVGLEDGDAPEPGIDVAFDVDLSQERGELSFRAEDHLELDPAAAERLLTASRGLIEQVRGEGKLRVRGFVIRAFGGPQASAALMSLFTLGNETRRSASFSYAAIGIGSDIEEVQTVYERSQPRDWTPRF